MREFLAQAESRLYQTISQPLQTSLCEFLSGLMKGTLNPPQRHCVDGVLLLFRAGIRVIGVTGGWFCVCCPVNWESRSAQHTLPSAKGQLRVFACPTVPGPLEFGSHWNISLSRISQGIQRDSCVLYWGQPAFWFLCWLWELCYNLLSEQVSWERALLVMCW